MPDDNYMNYNSNFEQELREGWRGSRMRNPPIDAEFSGMMSSGMPSSRIPSSRMQASRMQASRMQASRVPPSRMQSSSRMPTSMRFDSDQYVARRSRGGAARMARFSTQEAMGQRNGRDWDQAMGMHPDSFVKSEEKMWRGPRRSRMPEDPYEQEIPLMRSREPPMDARERFAIADESYNSEPRRGRIVSTMRRRPAGRSRASKKTQWIDRTGKQVSSPGFGMGARGGFSGMQTGIPMSEGKYPHQTVNFGTLDRRYSAEPSLSSVRDRRTELLRQRMLPEELEDEERRYQREIARRLGSGARGRALRSSRREALNPASLEVLPPSQDEMGWEGPQDDYVMDPSTLSSAEQAALAEMQHRVASRRKYRVPRTDMLWRKEPRLPRENEEMAEEFYGILPTAMNEDAITRRKAARIRRAREDSTRSSIMAGGIRKMPVQHHPNMAGRLREDIDRRMNMTKRTRLVLDQDPALKPWGTREDIEQPLIVGARLREDADQQLSVAIRGNEATEPNSTKARSIGEEDADPQKTRVIKETKQPVSMPMKIREIAEQHVNMPKVAKPTLVAPPDANPDENLIGAMKLSHDAKDQKVPLPPLEANPEVSDEANPEYRLGPMCERFLAWYSQTQPSNRIMVEEIAPILDVNYGRMADIMEILCNLGIVSKAGSKSYDWQGLQGLQLTMSELTKAERLKIKAEKVRDENERFALPPGSHNLLKELEEDDKELHSTQLKQMRQEVDSSVLPALATKTDTKSGKGTSGAINLTDMAERVDIRVKREGEPAPPPAKMKESENFSTAGKMAREILRLFVTEQVKRVPFDTIMNLLVPSKKEPETEGPQQSLFKIRDAIDVLRALELVDMIDAKGDDGEITILLIWVGSDILQVQNINDFEDVGFREGPPVGEASASEKSGIESGKRPPSDAKYRSRLPRYLKKSLAAMRRRRVGGRFAASVEKEAAQSTDEGRNFFMLSRDEEGIRAVQSFAFRHSAWSHHHGRVGIRSCRCVKSRCENRYCDCFASGAACLNCSCTNCGNVEKPMKRKRSVARGCRCMKSHCSKGHCDCFAAGKGCSERCQCLNCKNPLGSQHETASNSGNSSKRGGSRKQSKSSRFTPSKNSAFKYVKEKADPKDGGKADRNLLRLKSRKRQGRRRIRTLTAAGVDARGRKRKAPFAQGSFGSGGGSNSLSRKIPKRKGEQWKTKGHPWVGKEFLRVIDRVAETGSVVGWLPPSTMDGKKTNPVWLIRFDDGGMEECNEKQTRNGIRESSFKPGKKLKVLYEGKWILGILKKVSRTSNALRPYGVKLLGASGRSYNRLYWTPRACIKTLKKENKEPFKLPPESDDFDSDTTPNETSESKKHKGIGLGNGTEEEGEEEGEGHDEEAVVDPLDETKNDGDSDSTSAQDLVEVCFVPGEMVEWKFGVHWVKAKVKKRGESTRKGRSAIYTIQVLDKSAVKILGDEILPAVNERFLRHPRSTDKQDDAARGEGDQQSEEKQADPAEYKKRASPSHALDLVISVGQGSDDAGSADSAEKLHVQKSDEGDFDTDDANAIESSLEKIEYMEEEGPSEVSSGENGGNLEDDETDPEDADANLNTNGVEEQGVMGLGDLVAAAVAPNATKTDIEAGEAGKVGTGEEAEKVGTGEPNSNVSSRNNGEEGNDALDRSGTPNASVSTDVQSEPSGAVGAESKSQTSGDVRREFKETNGGSGNPVVQNDGNDESSVKSSNFEDDQGPKEPISANDITGSEQ